MNRATRHKRAEISEDPKEWQAIVNRAADGDESALPQLRTLLDKHPGIVGLDFGKLARSECIAWILRKNREDGAFCTVLLEDEVEALYSRLAGPGKPSELEVLLIERIVVSWLETVAYERANAQYRCEEPGIDEQLLCEKRLSFAHRRHLASIKALAQVRRLQLPAEAQMLPPAGTLAEFLEARGIEPETRSRAEENGREAH